MTTIKKDNKTGKYYFVLDAGRDLLTGKRKQLKRRGFETKKDAQIALAKLHVDVVSKREIDVTKVQFSKFIGQWFESKRIKLKPSTIQNYKEQIHYNITPYIGEVRMSEFNESVLRNYIQTLHNKRGLSPATIRTAYGIVAEVLLKASRKGLLSREILEDVSLPRQVKKLRVWSNEHIYTFLDAPKKIINLTRHFIGFIISIQTGMRMGEVLGLRWKDVDFEDKTITIHQTLGKSSEGGKYGFVEEGKTSSAIRVIYIPNSLIQSLKEHKQLILREQSILKESYFYNDLVVCTRSGNWVHPNNFRRAFKVSIEQLDGPKIRVHDLRHTHATFLLENKVNPKIIQERLGHKNVTITLNTYSHALPSMQLEAIRKFDEIFAECDHKSEM